MRSRTGTHGHMLAAAGGAGLALSLWLPWYSVQIPQSALNSLTQMSRQLGVLGPLMRSGAQMISQLGPFHVTAWQAFNTVPAVLLVVGIIGGGLAMLALGDRAGNTSQLTALAGIVGALLVGYRIAVPPSQSGFVHPAWGIYLALISALAMLVGGFLAGRTNAVEPALTAGLSAHVRVPADAWSTAAATATASPTDTWTPASVGPPAP